MFKNKYVVYALLLSIVLALTGCNTIEHRSDTLQKKPLAAIVHKVQIKPDWIIQAGDGIGKKDAKLLLANIGNSLYASDYKGNIVAVDKNSGKVLWNRDLNQQITAGPSVAEGKLVVGTGDAKIVALDLQDGNTVWSSKASSEVLAAPRIKDNVAYIHSLDGALSALNLRNGRQMWRFSLNIPALMLRRSSTPAVTNEHVISGFSNGKLVAIKRIDGLVDWVQDVSHPKGRSELQRMVDISADPIVDNGIVYAVSYRGNLVSYISLSGQQMWERDISSYSGLAIAGESLYVCATNGDIWSLEKSSGETFWLQPALQGRRLSKPAVMGKYLIIGDDDGFIHLLDSCSGDIVGRYQVDSKGVEATPVVIGKNIYVLGRGGKLASLQIYAKEQAK